MKKIVALVLSLVMVLGLATTAMAAPKAAYVADVADLDANYYTAYPQSEYTFKLEEQVAEISVTRTFAKYVLWATEKETKAPEVLDYFVLAASAETADFAFVDGNKITYLVMSDVNSENWDEGMKVAKVPTVDYVDVAACGDIYVGDDAALYTDANEALYYEVNGGSVTGYVDGKLVSLEAIALGDMFFDIILDEVEDNAALTGEVVFVAHDYDYDAKTVGGDETVTKVFCAECKKEFSFLQGTEAKAIDKFGAGNYALALVVDGDNVYVGTGTGAAAPEADATDKVESAETFDAGIAMYVGMSVMAAAGSAVVLKKKD